MFRIFAFVLSFVICTPLVLAEHTYAYYMPRGEMSRSYQFESANAEQTCSVTNKKKLNKAIDKLLRKKKIQNQSLEAGTQDILKKYRKYRKKEVKNIKKILKKDKRINKFYEKLKKRDPSIKKDQVIQDLNESLSLERTHETENKIVDEIYSYGSVANFLKDAKNKIDNCENLSNSMSADTWYLVLIIFLIGTPVLAILIAIVALFFAQWWVALGLFIYAVVLLLTVFIISNLGKNKKTLLPPDEDFDLELENFNVAPN